MSMLIIEGLYLSRCTVGCDMLTVSTNPSHCRRKDQYHSCYCLSGLSVAQHCVSDAPSPHPFVVGDMTRNLVVSLCVHFYWPVGLSPIPVLCHTRVWLET